MPKPTTNKSIFISVGIVVLAAIAYFYFQGSIPAASNSALEEQQNASLNAASARVLALLNQINSLHIDLALFKDPAYATLIDYTVEVPAIPVGRPNPFAPLPGEGIVRPVPSR